MLNVKEAARIIREAKPGATADGQGLYLKIGPSGAASWQFRFQIAGKRRAMGLGPCTTVSLIEARQKAGDAQKLVKAGIDPLEHASAAPTAPTEGKTFAEVAKEYIDGRAPGWQNAKHVEQWRNTLATYCKDFADKDVGEVSIDDAEVALRGIWLTKSETATRLLTRIVSVLTYAHDKGYREADDAETWSIRLRRRLPQLPKKAVRVSHHPALPYPQVGAFVADLRSREGSAARCLEFAILCASRSGEVRLAQWGEFDVDAGLWTIPADRMKMRREHRVPLSSQAVQVLRDLLATLPETPSGDTFVFPGARPGRPLSDMALTLAIRRRNEKTVKWADEKGEPIVPHGFRSTFRDWAAETTPTPSEVVEMALAHVVANRVEAAYRRGDLFDKRRLLMQEWADYCDQKQPTE